MQQNIFFIITGNILQIIKEDLKIYDTCIGVLKIYISK